MSKKKKNSKSKDSKSKEKSKELKLKDSKSKELKSQESKIGSESPVDNKTVRAAGCVVYRKSTKKGIEVLVVHRPLYDDWDFPKGKREKGESDLDCALRETKEETGFTGEISIEFEPSVYEVRGKPKVVRWWLMHQTGGAFSKNDEVDKVLWLSPKEAKAKVSYRDTQRLLSATVKHLSKCKD